MKFLKNIINYGCIIAVCCLAQSTHKSGVLPQQVYIWQKKWVPALKPAIEQTSPYITGWRFLAGEYEPDGQTIYPSIDFTILEATKLPLVAVYRFDRIRPLPTVQEILSLIIHSPAYQHHITHIELDLDWPTRKLKAYISLLTAIKQQLPQVEINITTIPDWFHASEFRALTQLVPTPVLQVHTVDNPRLGLFNSDLALTYVNTMNQLSAHPFYVALPTYGLRVGMNQNGNIYYIEGENNLQIHARGKELYSNPQEIRSFINQLQTNTPRLLKGIIWFRLPIENDQRNWDKQTWIRMLTHQKLVKKSQLEEIRVRPDDKLFNLYFSNDGNIPIPFPDIIKLRCSVADGFLPYQLEIRQNGQYELQLISSMPPLNPGQRQLIGWMRCSE